MPPPARTAANAQGQDRHGPGHYYFALPSDAQFKNAVGFLPGLDLRTTGGQVVAPPSRHPSGAKYVWDILPEQLAHALADIDIPYEGEIQPFAEAPEWLLEEIANIAK
ncbi:bifunctional DNA primase/polymerase [bacterium]|nr:bifunctional DNA primase/polymerase [bacterium]